MLIVYFRGINELFRFVSICLAIPWNLSSYSERGEPNQLGFLYFHICYLNIDDGVSIPIACLIFFLGKDGDIGGKFYEAISSPCLCANRYSCRSDNSSRFIYVFYGNDTDVWTLRTEYIDCRASKSNEL